MFSLVKPCHERENVACQSCRKGKRKENISNLWVTFKSVIDDSTDASAY